MSTNARKNASTTSPDIPAQLALQTWVKSDVGRVRKNNEDNFLADSVNGIFVVADGMGGHEHGELASQRAVEAIRNYFYNAMSGIKAFTIDPSEQRKAWVEQVMSGAIKTANAEVYRLACEKGAQKNMGTTLSMLLFLNANTVVLGHVGDSRIYRIRNKEVQQVTEDQTLLQQQIKLGKVKPEDTANIPYGGTLLQAVGYQPEVDPDVSWIDLEPGDQFLLCSDGLSNYLIEDEIVTVFSQSRGDQIVPRLIDCANARGGRDNITAIVVEVEDPTGNLASTQLDLGTDVLSQCPLLRGFELGDMTHLLPKGQLKLFIRDEVLQQEGEQGNGLLLILAGKVGLYRKGTWLVTVGSGGHIGDIEMFDTRGAAETAICEEEVRAILFPYEDLDTFAKEHPVLGVRLNQNISKNLARRLRDHEGRLVQLLGRQ